MDIQKLLKTEFWTVVLVTCTILGAFGGFPEPPKVFLKLTKYQPVQWLLVFVLVYQGGAGQDPLLAIAATAITFVLYTLLTYMERYSFSLEIEEPNQYQVAGRGNNSKVYDRLRSNSKKSRKRSRL